MNKSTETSSGHRFKPDETDSLTRPDIHANIESNLPGDPEPDETVKTDSDPEQAQEKKSILAQLWSFFAPTIISCAVVIIINTFFLFYATVPTGSMKNLIQEHSYILANRLAYVSSEVQRGDVVVFEHQSADPKIKYLVKRVVAVAGDTVELRDGKIWLNGTVQDESAYVLGQTYAYHSMDTFTVPEGCVLVFGDNREDSLDARSWDDPYLSVSNIRGKVFCAFSLRDWYFRTVG